MHRFAVPSAPSPTHPCHRVDSYDSHAIGFTRRNCRAKPDETDFPGCVGEATRQAAPIVRAGGRARYAATAVTDAADQLNAAVAAVPAGRWIVGVSGGADSVALLRAMRACRPEVTLVVAHLNHQTRGAESDGDAAFVTGLAASLGVEAAIHRLEEFEPVPPRPTEASFRHARMLMFQQLLQTRAADGVLLAHHANDRAETVLLRLLRGGEPWAIGGLRREARVSGVRMVRPLIDLPRDAIEAYLRDLGQSWRVDASNRSGLFARNRARQFLALRPELLPPLRRLAESSDSLRERVCEAAPTLSERFPAAELADLPSPIARRAARQWLSQRGVASPSAADAERLIRMCSDRSTPPVGQWPGGLTVRRRGKSVSVDGRSD